MNDHVNDHGRGRRMARAVTIRDVAEEAGVSRQTVSRAMNAKDEISEETRERILAVARRLGYRPNSIARGLKTNHTHTIGLVVPDIANPFFAEVARGASEVAYAHGYSVLLANTDERPDREWDTLRTLETYRVDGVILTSSRLSDRRLDDATELDRPLILVNRLLAARPGLGCVVVNDAEAAERAVAHLVERGHTRIGFLGGSADTGSGRERRAGYLRAMQVLAGGSDAAWWVPCAPNVEGGRQSAAVLLSECPDLTAVLAYNDLVAVGATQACQALGRPVPSACAVVGWDDIVFASYVSPPLTTLRMPKYQIGARAMELLLALLADPELVPEAVRLDAELVVRGST
ncbi:MAG: LacI family DNA-binding transcriptional regulator [Anaerolineae bacterium]